MYIICNTKVKEKSNWGVIVPTLYDKTDFRVVRGGGNSYFLDTNEQVDLLSPSPSRPSLKNVSSNKSLAIKIALRNAIISPLLDYAKEINSPHLQEYWAVLKCSTLLKQTSNNELIPKDRCGSRLCPICTNIRNFKLTQKLLPLISSGRKWGRLVLTRSNTPLMGADGIKLRACIDDYYKIFENIKRRAKKKGFIVDTIMAFEIEGEQYKFKKENKQRYYGPFNPHMNIIGPIDTLKFIRKQWISINQDLGNEIGVQNQHLTKIDSNNSTELKSKLKEVLKYTVKGISKFDSEKLINVKALDIITSAMKGRRRVVTSGIFYNIKTELIQEISIDKLELKANVYKDLPIVMDNLGEGVLTEKLNDVFIKSYFLNDVLYKYDNNLLNFYIDDTMGKRHYLYRYKNDKLPELKLPNIYVDKEKFVQWKSKIYQNESM